MQDLPALSARDVSMNMAETKPDRGQQDAEVLQHQQTYCRYALSNSSKPCNSWRAHTKLHENAFPPAEQSFRHTTAQQCKKLPSPFHVFNDSDVSPESFCSNHVALNEPLSASLVWDLCTHSLTTSLNDSTGVQHPETSLLSSTVSRERHYWKQQPSSISKHASAPVFPTPQDLNSFKLDSATSFASDTLSFQTSPSLSLPEQPCGSAASQSAIKLVDDSSTVLKEIKLQIISAPAMFAQPIGINRPISPPFQAKVEVCTEVPIKFHARLVAYLLSSDQVFKLQQWDPAAYVLTEDIVGSVAAATIMCNDQDVGESDGLYHFKGSSVFTFRDMKFATSSRMRPRWLVFALTLPNEDVLFVHYKVPTIIMSRACDQFEKAEAILKGQLPSRKRSRSLDVEESRDANADVIAQPQPVTALSRRQLSLPNPLPQSAHSLKARSQPASPSTPSRLRTQSSRLRVPSQISRSVYKQSVAEPAGHLVYHPDSLSAQSGAKALGRPVPMHCAQDSLQQPLESNLSSVWPASTADQSNQSTEPSFEVHDSDLAMLREAIAAAAQYQAPPQHSALAPQQPALTLPPSQPKPLVKSSSSSHLDPRLKAQSSQRKIHSSALRSVRSETLRWPTSGPYNIHRWQIVLVQLYKSCNLARPLTMQDVWVLGQVAGFHSDPILLDTECLSSHQWLDFGDWFISQLGLLRRHQTMWDRQDPVVLCSFEVDRVQCEHLLLGQMPGTFLIRPSISLTGCMVVSTVAENGSVKHLCLDSKQLYSRALEVWVRDAVEAQYFLDYRTGRVWHKEQVFLMQYRRFGVVPVPQERPVKNAAQHMVPICPVQHSSPILKGTVLTGRQ
ncbi:hypothetical protein WJX79_002939 [Trebouxia sp. C0005]